MTCSGETGLGERIDFQYPKLEIKTPKVGQFSKKSVLMNGTCSDDGGIASVKIYKMNKSGGFDFVKSADVSGDTWSAVAEFEEGNHIIQVVATDRSGYSYSRKRPFFVDETPPTGNAWYIDRQLGGINYDFHEKSELEDIVNNGKLKLSSYRNAAQNVAFTIHGTMNDAMGVKKVSILIRDDEGKNVCVIQNDGFDEDDSRAQDNKYSPLFKVTQSDFVGKTGLSGVELRGESDAKVSTKDFSTGKHYLEVSYDATDVVTNPAPNVTVEPVPIGWLLWWPESDNPHIECNDITTESGSETIQTSIKNTLMFSIFDDDELGGVWWALLNDTDYNGLKSGTTINWATFKSNAKVKKETCADGEFEKQVPVQTGDSPANMHFVALAEGAGATDGSTSVKKDISVIIKDENTPVLFITSPQNNEVPTVTMNVSNTTANFTITGQTLDTSGCSYLDFVYVPDGVASGVVAKTAKAKEILQSYTRPAMSSSCTKTVSNVSSTTAAKATIWSAKLSDATADVSSGWKKQTFSFSVDLFSDFGAKGSANNEISNEKFFLVALTRSVGNDAVYYFEHKLKADDELPIINIVEPQDEGAPYDGTADVLVKYYAAKESGLGINTAKYKISVLDSQNNSTVLSGSSQTFDGHAGYQVTVPKATLQSWEAAGTSFPVFVFEAEDVLGNKNEARRTISISNLPQIKSITSRHANGTTFKAGDEIEFYANFSDTVSCLNASDIKLKLTGIKLNGESQTRSATAVSATKSTKVTFKYTVQENETGDPVSVDTSNPIVVGSGAKIMSGDGGNPVLVTLASSQIMAGKSFKIDAVRPTVTDVTLSSDGVANGGKTYCNVGKTLTASVKVDKAVYVQGEPVLNCGGILLKYVGVATSGMGSAATSTLTFEKTIVASDTNAEVFINKASGWSGTGNASIETIQDAVGNKLKNALTGNTASFVVDTVSPQKPTLTWKKGSSTPTTAFSPSTSSGGNVMKENVSFELTGESGSALQYSLNGGSSWQSYSASVQLPSGECSVCARQTDKAGNVSPISDIYKFDIVNAFPTFSVDCKNADGHYKAGSVLRFSVNLSRKISGTPASCNIALGGGKTATCTDSSISDKNVINFSYTVQATDSFSLSIAEGAVTLTGVQDSYGNTWASENKNAAYARSGIVCDGVAPTVTSVTHAAGNSATVTIAFSEKVNKGSGKIILQQRAGWSIPPVMSVSDFNKVYNQLDNTRKQYLKQTDSGGNDIMDTETASGDVANNNYHGTGQGVGPYIKTTHGLKVVAGKYVPDTETKYVLRFDYNIDGTDQSVQCKQTVGSQLGAAVTVSQIRSAFETAGYHKREIDVTSSAVVASSDKKSYTVTFPASLIGESELAKGRDWEVLLDAGAFVDDTGNESSALESGNTQSQFSSSGVETPVVRVDRFSYGVGIKQYSPQDTNGTAVANTAQTAPTGYVRVRIDCETQGATIKYEERTKGTATSGTTTWHYKGEWSQELDYKISEIADIEESSPTSSISAHTDYTQNTILYIASGNESANSEEASKKYIYTTASKTGSGSSLTGREGIFRTVMKFHSPKNHDTNNYKVHGTTGVTSMGETPAISGFPLRYQAYGSAYIRRCYAQSDSEYYWVSYEIMSECYIGGRGNENGSTWGKVNYGQVTECTGAPTW